MLVPGFLLGFFVALSGPTPSLQIPQNIQLLLDARQYLQAEQIIQSELEHRPAWDVGYLLLAQIYSITGRHDLAERSALSAVRLKESLDGFMLLALASQRLNKINESIEWLEKAARRQPEYPEIYKLLGVNYALGGMLKESEKSFRRSVELDPKNWELHYLLGRSVYEADDLKNAEEAFQRAIEQSPSSVKTWTALGQVQERLHDRSLAEQSYRKALQLCGSQSRECAWPMLQMGFLTERQKGAREAEPFFRRAVAVRPDWAKPHFYLGKALVTLGELRDAQAALETAVRLDEGKSQYHYQLAQLYRRLKQTQKAKEHLTRYQALAELERKQKATVDLSTE
ncbi:MAG: tetratricopeptide repeat protein [Acidobacteria bacterium]|nr:tetratricopeptide repeat protein [Acidobacteriota bacterium]